MGHARRVRGRGLRIDVSRSRFWLFAWLLPIGVLAAMVVEAKLFGTAVGLSGPRVVPLSMLGAVAAVPLLWGEEFGWRGYLQTRLLPGRPVGAAIVTGLIWAVWHYPLTLRGYDFPDRPVLGSLLFIVPTYSFRTFSAGYASGVGASGRRVSLTPRPT